MLILSAAAVLVEGGGLGTSPARSSTTTATCASGPPVTRANLASVHFDAITKFALPAPDRSPNAIATASDGSVWFGEQGLPGLGHLSPNGTLTEYRWPFNYTSSASFCGDRTDIWGVALWNGGVWGTDAANSQLVGLDPQSGSFESVPVTKGSFPYTLAVGPRNHLWFTALTNPPVLGSVSPDSHQVQYFQLPGSRNSSSAYVTFVNSTLAYVLTIDPLNGSGSLFSFDPGSSPPSFQSVQGTQILYSPTSIAFGAGGLWLTQHSASAMAFHGLGTGGWGVYPTSRVNYTLTTLTYFDAANSTAVWFNEHYGNKLGVIYSNGTRLTEYSLSDPPPLNGSQIDNALTMTMGGGRVWFTEWTANYVGFASMAYDPGFQASLGDQVLRLSPGGAANVTLTVSGNHSGPLRLQFSDSEAFSSVPKSINMSASTTVIPSLQGTRDITVSIKAGESLPPGNYRLLVTVDGGLIRQSAYLLLEVGP